jgi:hypothetical protein
MQVLFLLIFYSLIYFFIFVILKIYIITVFPFPCFICTARHWCSATVVNCHLGGCRIGLATTTRTWRWNISSQVQLISRPRFCHLGGCRTGLAKTDNGLEWTGPDRHIDSPRAAEAKNWYILIWGVTESALPSQPAPGAGTFQAVWLISGPRFCHLGGCKIGLVETDNGSVWTSLDRHIDRPSELIYRIPTRHATTSLNQA